MPALTITDLAADPPGFTIEADEDTGVGYYRETGAGGPLAPVDFLSLANGVPQTVNVPRGLYYFAGANLADPAALTALVRLQVTDGTAAVATRSRTLIADLIRGLALQLYVYEQWNTSDLTNVMYPCAILTTENVQETREKSFNATDDVGRPVKVSLCDRVAVTDHTRLAMMEYVRERIERRFHNSQLDMPESVIAKVEYNGIVDPSLPKLAFCLSEFVIRHVTREYRG